jgi:hypothetical protein
MPDPKTPTPSGAQSRSKAEETTTPATDPQADPLLLQGLLTQLTSLAASAKQLADDQTPPAGTPDPVAEERKKVLFAYEFLGEVLGRRLGSRFFATPKVTVDRDFTSATLTFTGLPATSRVARVRAAGGGVEVLPLPDPLPDPTQGATVPVTEIPNAEAIDSIVILDGRGVPLALGNCLDGQRFDIG